MEQGVPAPLDAFARHTRSTRDPLTLRTQKWLALVGSNADQTEKVYAHIAPDFRLMSLRTHQPALSAYSDARDGRVDVDAFVWAMQRGHEKADPVALIQSTATNDDFNRFCNAVLGMPADTEGWEPYKRTDLWKDRALFLAAVGSQHRPEFFSLVRAIYANGLEEPISPTSLNELYGAICSFMKDAPVPSAENVAQIIKSVNLNHVNANSIVPTSENDTHDVEHDFPLAKRNEPVTPIQMEFTEAAAVAAETQSAVLQPYREKSALAITFPTEKLAKQVLLVGLGQTNKKSNPKLFAPMQVVLPPVAVDLNEWRAAAALIGASLSHGDQVAVIEKHANDHVREFYTQWPVKSPAQFVSSYLGMYAHPELRAHLLEEQPADFKAFQRRWLLKHPQPDAAMIRVMLEM